MRALIPVILVLFVSFGCSQSPQKEEAETDSGGTDQPAPLPIADLQSASIQIKNLSQLIPIDTVNSESNDAFKKYGLEFNGNCYACDLANISITGESVYLTNVCDEKIKQLFEMVQFSGIDNRFEVKTRQIDFMLTEIDPAPIYELKIIGKNVKIENLRISKYYTLKSLLNRFEQHDCGEFDG